jgi:hypothetical protein
VRRGPGGLGTLALATLAWLTAGDAAAQGVRGSATTTVRYIEMRPIQQDTVSRERVTELPDGSFEFEGIPVSCVTGLPCVFYRSLDVQQAVIGTQDVSLTAWGLGVQGLSVTGLLRARTDFGSDFVWPQANDNFDAILAYAELNRGIVRARAGRQRLLTGLGFSGYDGLSALVQPLDWLELEAYGGRSLARGLNEPRNEALQGIEDFVLDRGAWLAGGSARFEPFTGTAITARYQREIWSSRSSLISERASLDVSTSQFLPVIFDAGMDYDFAFGRIGKAHATVRAPVVQRLTLEATARRYLPYFELWTIWGFFSPVAYHEGEARATWLASPSFTAWASGGYRRYDEANATVVFGTLTQDGIRAAAGARWQATESVATSGSYRMERGFGAFLSSGEVSLDWRPLDRLSLSLDGSAMQQIEQFRVGEGVVFGGGAAVDVELPSNMLFSAGATMYRQNFENRPGIADWNQLRAWTTLRIGVGSDPGRFRGARTQPSRPGSGER